MISRASGPSAKPENRREIVIAKLVTLGECLSMEVACVQSFKPQIQRLSVVMHENPPLLGSTEMLELHVRSGL